jgi:transcriptional repressor NrdR
MKCPYCGFLRDRVVDSRESREGDVIRRRRHCLKCEKRFTSYEKIESIPFQVVKRDEGREAYSRDKLMTGLQIACRKRPVPAASLDDIADEIELMMQESSEREISSLELGNLVMKKLRPLDQVAYVRFASVYRRFEDVDEFLEELEDLRKKKTDDADA